MGTTGTETESKACNKCGTAKKLNEYPKDPRNKSGLGGICKKCISERRRERYRSQEPIERQIRNMAANILHRTSGRTAKKYYYDKGIRCKIGSNYTEIRDYLREHFSDDIEAMLARGNQVSVDRIESDKHYEHGNIRIMSHKENSLMGSMASQKSQGHNILIKDIKTGETTKAPSIYVAAKAIGCSPPAIGYHLKHNSAPIFKRYKITRESE